MLPVMASRAGARTAGELLCQGNPLGTAVGQLPAARRVLVLAPHPDDEILGCGGTLVRYLAAGSAVAIVYLTDGEHGENDPQAPARRREAEAVGARLTGCEQSFWALPDGSLCERQAEVVERLTAELVRFSPDLVFLPWFLDRHPDHRTTARAAVAAAAARRSPPCFAAYEGLASVPANHAVDITARVERKRELLALYASQQRRYPLDAVWALHRWRAQLQRRPRLLAAEAFHIATRDSFVALADRLFAPPPGPRRKPVANRTRPREEG
jgi:LmbE family N-acetylglucosaminyl deacetylase